MEKNLRDRTDMEDIEEIGLNLLRIHKLFDILACLNGADQQILRTNDIAEVFELLSDYMSVIRGDVDAVINQQFQKCQEKNRKDSKKTVDIINKSQ